MYRAVVITVFLFYVDRNQSVFDWRDMSLIETCISALTCICGNWFFAPLVKRKSTPNHVHIYTLNVVCTYHNIILSGQ